MAGVLSDALSPGHSTQPQAYPPSNGGYGYPNPAHQGPLAYPAHAAGAAPPPYPQPAQLRAAVPAVQPMHVDMAAAPATRSRKGSLTASQRQMYVDGEDADNEHLHQSSCGSGLDAIKEDYGRGAYIYFHYIRFLGAANGALAVVALAAWWLADTEGLVGSPGFPALFLLSAYPAATAWAWYMATTLQVLIAFSIGPVYRRYQQYATSHWSGENRTEEIERHDDIELYDSNGAKITTSAGSRRARKLASISVFIVIVVAQGVFTWVLHEALAEQSDTTVAQVIAVVISVLNVLWKKVGKILTKFERHKTWTSYREWDCGKAFVLKIINILVLYIVKARTAPAAAGCPLNAIGTQFFWLIVSDLTVNNALEFGVPLATWFINMRKANSSGVGDARNKAQFDLAEEYVEVLYRQFIIILGMVSFPTITVIGVFSYVLEYWLDKARLIYLCGMPDFKEEPLHGRLVMAASLAVSVAALLSFPYGAIWIMAGVNMDGCPVFS